MPVVKVEPTDEHPMPYDLSADEPETFVEELQVAGETAELLVELGAELGGGVELSKQDQERQKNLLAEVVKNRAKEPLKDINTAYAASAFLKTYGSMLAFDVAQARTAITAKLMEIANCGETKFELRALELLGKHSDIGLFTERSEITITHTSPESLEEAIKERVKRLLSADIIDVTPITRKSLDEELGVAEYEEPKPPLESFLDAPEPSEPEEGE